MKCDAVAPGGTSSPPRAQHGAKWSRTASGKLTGTFTANAAKYRTIINNATQADGMVKEKLSAHMVGMQVDTLDSRLVLTPLLTPHLSPDT